MNTGKFNGQSGYGYKSFEVFIESARKVNLGEATSPSFDDTLATLATTFRTTAVLEAGRKSLDEHRVVLLKYDNQEHPTRPTSIE